mmetsp:Transcript_106221/g.193339  ORF Transcript_106221/g.193339 Transcript_106221/m.193339 type:complete len:452 (-) Transcript_106221:70-1425(-)
MRKSFLLLACSACLCHARRVLLTTEELRSGSLAEKKLLVSDDDPKSIKQLLNKVSHVLKKISPQSRAEQSQSTAADTTSPWNSPDVQRVLMMFCMIAIGYALRGRFPGTESGAVQKLLLQFLVPATLFRGMSKEKIAASHIGYLASGVLLTVARALSSWLASCAALGFRSCPSELSKLRRTAIFELSTIASALSVLPFVSEFVGPEFVGLGGMVDLPMKFYNLVVMPLLLNMFNGAPPASSKKESPNGQLVAAITQLLKDPITMSLIFGIVTAIATDCRGLKALGFFGDAVEAMATAQTPILFLLIGMKLNFQTSMPLICVVILLANHGILLIMVEVLLRVVNPGENATKLIIIFSQGAPSLLGLGVISSAVESGLHGYSPDFTFDIVAMAFPMCSVLQCASGLVGASYANAVGVVGLVLLAAAGVLRVAFKERFQESSAKKCVDSDVAQG